MELRLSLTSTDETSLEDIKARGKVAVVALASNKAGEGGTLVSLLDLSQRYTELFGLCTNPLSSESRRTEGKRRTLLLDALRIRYHKVRTTALSREAPTPDSDNARSAVHIQIRRRSRGRCNILGLTQ